MIFRVCDRECTAFRKHQVKERTALSPKCNTCVTASVPFCYTFEVVFNFKILIVNNLFFLARFLFEEISGCGVGLNKWYRKGGAKNNALDCDQLVRGSFCKPGGRYGFFRYGLWTRSTCGNPQIRKERPLSLDKKRKGSSFMQKETGAGCPTPVSLGQGKPKCGQRFIPDREKWKRKHKKEKISSLQE